MNFQKVPVLIVGDKLTACSLAVCMLEAGHAVTLLCADTTQALDAVDTHLKDLDPAAGSVLDRNDFEIVNRLDRLCDFPLSIAVTDEDLAAKHAVVHQLENILPKEALIAINTESIALSDIQRVAARPGHIVGANWTEPVHTTFFLEIIANKNNRSDLVNGFFSTAKAYWLKDPYLLRNDYGIRSRMMSAMVREAFFLIENEYVGIEDIDRACRNDPGYYLPFAGHCRYMDLMGSYVYGAVMKDLNPELSKAKHIPPFFTRIVESGGEGLANAKGFYTYEAGEIAKRRKEFREFSYAIRDIISKYPFSERSETKPAGKKALTNS